MQLWNKFYGTVITKTYHENEIKFCQYVCFNTRSFQSDICGPLLKYESV